jgi:protocatechuate 3,4-dioxygenase beta subunit
MIRNEQSRTSRRHFLGSFTSGAAALTGAVAFFTTRGAFAEQLLRTPPMTEGPFYPDKLPLDTDNDLIILNDNLTPAVGEITHLTGRILDATGSPVRDATIEIWQCDANEVYHHTADLSSTRNRVDTNFQGFGRFTTGTSGEYYFRTIKPVPYPGRTPHIHFKVKHKGQDKLTTQCYVKGEPQNDRDGIYRSIRDPKQRESITVDFAPVKESRIGELAAKFDLVLGVTPEM